jgi:hypothetical protein
MPFLYRIDQDDPRWDVGFSSGGAILVRGCGAKSPPFDSHDLYKTAGSTFSLDKKAGSDGVAMKDRREGFSEKTFGTLPEQ